jgi:lysophospholipase L1-like esterase
MIGDSTMANKPLIPAQPERGWGQLLPLYFKSDARVENLALNGRSSKSFRDEGHWTPVMENATNGDFVIIQFGHNDEKADPKRHTDAFGSFKENLVGYIKEARQKGAAPILATSIVRRAFTNGTELIDTHGDYIVAARQVATEQSVPLLDLNRDTQALLIQLGPDRSKQLFMWVAPGDFESVPKGKQDDTHLNAYGATRVCDLAVKEIKEAVPALAEHLKPSR